MWASTALHCSIEPLKFLNVDNNADPDPAFHSKADPDPTYKNNADPDPQPCKKDAIIFKQYETMKLNNIANIRGVLGNKCAGQHNLKTVYFKETIISGYF